MPKEKTKPYKDWTNRSPKGFVSHVKKDPKTSITHLLPAHGRPSAHKPAKSDCGSISKQTRWDAEKQKKTEIWYTVIDMARRLAVGRTPELVIALMETRLFSKVEGSVWTGLNREVFRLIFL